MPARSQGFFKIDFHFHFMKVKLDKLSSVLTITPRRVSQLVADRIIQQPTGGKYDLEAAVGAYIKFLKDSRKPSLDEARQLKVERETELLEIELQEKRRELIPAAEIREVVMKGLVAMMASINSASNLEREDKDKLILELRRVGEAVVGVSRPSEDDQAEAGVLHPGGRSR